MAWNWEGHANTTLQFSAAHLSIIYLPTSRAGWANWEGTARVLSLAGDTTQGTAQDPWQWWSSLSTLPRLRCLPAGMGAVGAWPLHRDPASDGPVQHLSPGAECTLGGDYSGSSIAARVSGQAWSSKEHLCMGAYCNLSDGGAPLCMLNNIMMPHGDFCTSGACITLS